MYQLIPVHPVEQLGHRLFGGITVCLLLAVIQSSSWGVDAAPVTARAFRCPSLAVTSGSDVNASHTSGAALTIAPADGCVFSGVLLRVDLLAMEANGALTTLAVHVEGAVFEVGPAFTAPAALVIDAGDASSPALTKPLAITISGNRFGAAHICVVANYSVMTDAFDLAGVVLKGFGFRALPLGSVIAIRNNVFALVDIDALRTDLRLVAVRLADGLHLRGTGSALLLTNNTAVAERVQVHSLSLLGLNAEGQAFADPPMPLFLLGGAVLNCSGQRVLLVSVNTSSPWKNTRIGAVAVNSVFSGGGGPALLNVSDGGAFMIEHSDIAVNASFLNAVSIDVLSLYVVPVSVTSLDAAATPRIPGLKTTVIVLAGNTVQVSETVMTGLEVNVLQSGNWQSVMSLAYDAGVYIHNNAIRLTDTASTQLFTTLRILLLMHATNIRHASTIQIMGNTFEALRTRHVYSCSLVGVALSAGFAAQITFSNASTLTVDQLSTRIFHLRSFYGNTTVAVSTVGIDSGATVGVYNSSRLEIHNFSTVMHALAYGGYQPRGCRISWRVISANCNFGFEDRSALSIADATFNGSRINATASPSSAEFIVFLSHSSAYTTTFAGGSNMTIDSPRIVLADYATTGPGQLLYVFYMYSNFQVQPVIVSLALGSTATLRDYCAGTSGDVVANSTEPTAVPTTVNTSSWIGGASYAGTCGAACASNSTTFTSTCALTPFADTIRDRPWMISSVAQLHPALGTAPAVCIAGLAAASPSNAVSSSSSTVDVDHGGPALTGTLATAGVATTAASAASPDALSSIQLLAIFANVECNVPGTGDPGAMQKFLTPLDVGGRVGMLLGNVIIGAAVLLIYGAVIGIVALVRRRPLTDTALSLIWPRPFPLVHQLLLSGFTFEAAKLLYGNAAPTAGEQAVGAVALVFAVATIFVGNPVVSAYFHRHVSPVSATVALPSLAPAELAAIPWIVRVLFVPPHHWRPEVASTARCAYLAQRYSALETPEQAVGAAVGSEGAWAATKGDDAAALAAVVQAPSEHGGPATAFHLMTLQAPLRVFLVAVICAARGSCATTLVLAGIVCVVHGLLLLVARPLLVPVLNPLQGLQGIFVGAVAFASAAEGTAPTAERRAQTAAAASALSALVAALSIIATIAVVLSILTEVIYKVYAVKADDTGDRRESGADADPHPLRRKSSTSYISTRVDDERCSPAARRQSGNAADDEDTVVVVAPGRRPTNEVREDTPVGTSAATGAANMDNLVSALF